MSAKKTPIPGAQRDKRYVENLKESNKYDEYKKKKAEAMKKLRANRKEEEKLMSISELGKAISMRRAAGCERSKKYRQKLKQSAKETQIDTNPSCSLSEIVQKSYRCSQTLGKAVKKVSKAFPASPRKKTAVLTLIVANLDEVEKQNLVSVVTKAKPNNQPVTSQLPKEIGIFFERDDISQVSPIARHVKKYKCADTGENILIPTRHMTLSIREAFALFTEERNKNQLSCCSLSFFKKHRPEHVKPINELPHNTCMCSYHSNFMEGVSALQKVAANVPRYDDGFVRQFLCQEASMDCWFAKCNQCSGISLESLKSAVGNVSLQSPVSWIVWEKSAQSKRIEKHKKKGTLESLFAHIAALSPQFLKHSYIKREQSLIFNKHDIPRASNADYAVEALLQMDFAENFVCEAQDEIQSAHWNQRQLALFTSAFYHNDIFQSKVFVSDNLSHTKDVIVPYIYKLLSGMPSSVKILKLWTDGPSSQFKNKFIATIIPHFEKIFGMQIIWNYLQRRTEKGA